MMIRTTGLAALCAASLACTAALAADDSGSEEDMYAIAEVTCKEVMILSGNDRDEVIAFLHGYLAGEGNKVAVDAVKLGHATDAFLNACLDSPNAKALQTLRGLLGG